VAGPCDPNDWGGPLVTFPTSGTWSVPRRGWHLDLPVRGAPETTLAVKWLGYLEPVRPHAGGTVVIAGSHRLVAAWRHQAVPDDPGRSPDVRDAIFALDPWFAGLTSGESGPVREQALAAGAHVRDVDVRVVELDGEAGDVVLVHPHLLHAAAPNHGSEARVMVTGGVYEVR
jgi:ectoine hydroxylase-related dioxygenase (phytanoyl-CoA dioxygenase family)